MNYIDTLRAFSEFTANLSHNKVDPLRRESIVECLKDWSELDTIDTIKEWFLGQQKSCSMSVEDIPLMDCIGWSYNQEKGIYEHKSGEFFYVLACKCQLICAHCIIRMTK